MQMCIRDRYITDPLLVLSYNQTLPLGYEPDGLLIAPIRSLPSTAPDYNKEEADSLHTMENMHRMLRKLRDYPGVQNAAPLVTFAFPGSGGSSYNTYAYDTLAIPASISYFIPHTGFFETCGFKTFEGKTLGELDNKMCIRDSHGYGDIVQLPAFLLVEGEADKVGRTVEEETAARHLMVIAVDAIEITVEQ